MHLALTTLNTKKCFLGLPSNVNIRENKEADEAARTAITNVIVPYQYHMKISIESSDRKLVKTGTVGRRPQSTTNYKQ